MINANRLIIGQFNPGTSLVYRLDPRTKIIFVFLVMLIALTKTSILFYLALIILLFAFLTISQLGLRTILNGLKPVIWFVFFTALFHLVFSGHDDPEKIIEIGSFAISGKAVTMAIVFSSRIVIFVLATFLVSLTTNPLSISEAIVSLLRPLRLIRIPVDDLGMILFIALRFVPVLANELDAIRKAQLIRGVSFSGGVIQRIKRFAVLILPVFFSALRRADDLSVAIETRGYRSGQPRSSLHPLKFKITDYVILVIGFGATIVLIWESYPFR